MIERRKAMAELKTESLGNNVFAVLSDIHTFGTDAFLLYDFAQAKRKERICDLCSGCGIIPLLILREERQYPVTAVEIQPDACELIQKGIEMSSLEGKLNVLNKDLKNLKEDIEAGTFDLITVNPPYFPIGSGYDCEDEPHRMIRSEVCCTLEDIVSQSARLLRSGGRMCMCHRPERLTDIICSMRLNKLEPKRLRFVAKNENCAPWLVLIEGRKDAKSSLLTEKTLYMNDKKELERIYGGYAN